MKITPLTLLQFAHEYNVKTTIAAIEDYKVYLDLNDDKHNYAPYKTLGEWYTNEITKD